MTGRGKSDLSTAVTIFISEEERWAGDPHGKMVAAIKERQERMKRLAAEAQAAQAREEQAQRQQREQAAKIAHRRPPRIVWDLPPVDKATPQPAPEPVLTKRPSIRRIIMRVAAHYNLKPLDIISFRKSFPLIIPRHVAYYLATEITGLSLGEISKHFAGRDHTTILYGRNKINALMEYDEQLKADVEFLLGALLTEDPPPEGDPPLG